MRKTWRIRALVALTTVFTVVFGFGLVTSNQQPAQATAPLQTLNLLAANQDSNHPYGSTDPYTDVTIDNGTTWQPAIISGPFGWAASPGTNAWLNCVSIDPNDTMGSCSATLPVRALFRYRFYVANDFQNASLTGVVNVDNTASVYLNGISSSQRISGPIYGWPYTVKDIGTGADPAQGTSPINVQSLLVPGWNVMYVELDDQGGSSGINFNLTLSLNSNSPITLASPGSIVTFDAQGGAVTPQSETVAPAAALSTITLPTPTRSGYTFDGWFTASTGGTQVTPSYASSTIPTADLTLYAQWTQAATVPGAPTSVNATAGASQVAVSWTPPTSTGGSPITSYTVTASGGAGTCTVLAPATSCVITGLNPGTSYTFTVVATNAQGSSAASSPAALATPLSSPIMPSNPPTTSSQLTLSLGINAATGVQAGDDILISGTGFAPNSDIDVYIYSSPTYAGRGHAGASGSFSFTVPVPPGLERGTHTVVATGFDTNGQSKFASAPIQIRAASSSLARTGGSGTTIFWIAGGLAIVVVGGTGLLLARRSQRKSEHEDSQS